MRAVAWAQGCPTWRPDIRAAVISRTRINLRRKIVKHAAFTGQYPIAILSDCVVYAAGGPRPLEFLPYREGKPLPGGFKLGSNPGLVKHEGPERPVGRRGPGEVQRPGVQPRPASRTATSPTPTTSSKRTGRR